MGQSGFLAGAFFGQTSKNPWKRPILLAAFGALVAMILVYGPLAPHGEVAVVALIIGTLVGMSTSRTNLLVPGDSVEHSGTMTRLNPQILAEEPELFVAHQSITASLQGLAVQHDSILCQAALVRLVAVQEELRSLARGQIVFTATEAWRTLYDQILRSGQIGEYRSVAWIRSEDYWQDAPGRQSMQMNFELVEQGVRVERLFILCDYYWPPAASLPCEEIWRWIHQQHRRGVVVHLVRESQIEAEPALLNDFGIYGQRATGLLELDNECRTTKFTFDFTAEGVRLADERWRQLLLFAVSYEHLLDLAGKKG